MKLGIALGGGSLRGAAHVGILQVLEENGIIPDLVAGTSAGSIVASLFASGLKAKQIANFFNFLPGLKERDLAKFMSVEKEELIQVTSWLPKIPKGLISSNLLEKLLAIFIGRKTFDQLKKPLAVIATDIYNGQGVVYTSTNQRINLPPDGKFTLERNKVVIEAVTASCAIPGVFTPKTIGQKTLVDGGVVDNVPADIVKGMGADIVIAVDLGFNVNQTTPFRHMIDIILQTFDIMGQRITNLITTDYADLTLRPVTGSATLYDFHKIPYLIETGRQEAERRLPEIKKILRK
jgi:NTE family protein